mgnify:CR=1 FL=1
MNNNENKGCLTKADLADTLFSTVIMDKNKANEIIEDFLELIKEGLESDKKVMISRFGVFEVVAKDSRPGRNPQTGERITLAARNNVKFTPSQILKEQVNGQLSPEDEE